jgi:hypothetical protein
MRILPMALSLVVVCGCGSTPTQVTSVEVPTGPSVTGGLRQGPTIWGLSPDFVIAGSPDLTVTVRGKDFVYGTDAQSLVKWSAKGGAESSLDTHVTSSNDLTARIPAALLTIPGQATLSVVNADLQSAGVLFDIVSRPTLTTISPARAVAGTSDLVLTLTATNFGPSGFWGPIVKWSLNGHDSWLNPVGWSRTAPTMTVLIPATLLTSPGTATVAVVNAYLPLPDNDFDSYPQSDPVPFEISAPVGSVP